MFRVPSDRHIFNPKTCWSRKTPFQNALVLILLVAVPFLIAMIIVYVYYGIMAGDWKANKASENDTDYPVVQSSGAFGSIKFQCSDGDKENCKKHSMGTPHPQYDDLNLRSGHYEHDPENEDVANGTFKRSVISNNKKSPQQECDFPPIAALLESLYIDAQEEQIVRCSVAVVATDWILTVDDCLTKLHHQLLSVRFGSNYWSQGGILKKIQRVVSFNRFMAIQTQQDVKNSCFINVSSGGSLANESHIFYWDGNINLSLQKKTKYGALKAIDLKIQNDVEGRCIGEVGSPLLDKYRTLIGFQVSSSCAKNMSHSISFSHIKIENDLLEFLKNII